MGSQELSDAEAWQIQFALSEEPRSVRRAGEKGFVLKIANIAVRYGLTPVEALAYSIDEKKSVVDPGTKHSLIPLDVKEVAEITPELLAKIESLTHAV